MTRQCKTLLLHAEGHKDVELDFEPQMARLAKQHAGVYASAKIRDVLHVYVRSADWMSQIVKLIKPKSRGLSE